MASKTITLDEEDFKPLKEKLLELQDILDNNVNQRALGIFLKNWRITFVLLFPENFKCTIQMGFANRRLVIMSETKSIATSMQQYIASAAPRIPSETVIKSPSACLH